MTTAIKQPKLTAKQQEVVNLMAAGYELSWHQGIRDHNWTRLSTDDDDRKVPCNIQDKLKAKGLVKIKHSDPWGKGSTYALTELGKSLAQKVKKSATETWWKIGGWESKIESAEYASSTDDFLIRANGMKDKKVTQWSQWFPTREAAVSAHRKKLEQDVASAQRELKQAQKALDSFNRREK